MSIPLDSDGFLRRQCPTCERELKWFVKQDEDGGEDEIYPEPESGYYCPYCAVQAPGGEWHTEAQVELAKSILMQQFIDPQLEEFKRNVEQMNTSGFISISFEHETSEPADPLTESDDMKRIDFACHPAMPIKVIDDWIRQAHCPICGSSVEHS